MNWDEPRPSPTRARRRLGVMVGFLGLAVAIVLSLWAASQVFRGNVSFGGILHLAGAGVYGLSMPYLLGPTARRPKAVVPLLFFSLGFFVPIFGQVGLGAALAYAFWGRRLGSVDAFRYIPRPTLPNKPLVRDRHTSPCFSEGALCLVLRNASDPEKRVAAVMALGRMDPVRAAPLLQIALKDPVDDVRLLAYALLDGIDQQINRRIRDRTQALILTPPDRQTGLRKAIAQDYWDLAFIGLATGDVEKHVLEQAAFHIEVALEQKPDGSSALLLGQVRLRQGRLEEAESAFSRARDLGLPSVAVGPHWAEAAFVRRRFDEVRAHLAELPSTSRDQLLLAGVFRFWLEKETTS